MQPETTPCFIDDGHTLCVLTACVICSAPVHVDPQHAQGVRCPKCDPKEEPTES